MATTIFILAVVIYSTFHNAFQVLIHYFIWSLSYWDGMFTPCKGRTKAQRMDGHHWGPGFVVPFARLQHQALRPLTLGRIQRLKTVSFISSIWPRKWERALALQTDWGVGGLGGWGFPKRQVSCKVRETLKASGWVTTDAGKLSRAATTPNGMSPTNVTLTL